MPTAKIMTVLALFVGISGCFSVLFGAWLAHGGPVLPIALQERLSTALQYQFIHTLALMLTIILYKVHRHLVLVFTAIFYTFGVLLFSGSLYIKTFFDMAVIGKFAPIGGLSFALAWLLLGFVSSKMFQHKLGK